MIVCFCLASALLLAIFALTWLLIASMSGRCPRAGQIGGWRKGRTQHGQEGSNNPSNPIGFSSGTVDSDEAPLRRASATTRSGNPDCEEVLSLQNMERGKLRPMKRMGFNNGSVVSALSVGMNGNGNGNGDGDGDGDGNGNGNKNGDGNDNGNGNTRHDHPVARTMTRSRHTKSLSNLDHVLKPKLFRP